MMNTKNVNEMAIGRIRLRLEMYGFKMTDEQFEGLTYRELRKIYRKAKRVSDLRLEISKIISKPDEKKK